MRLGPSSKHGHPGIVMLDDLTESAVEQLSRDGFEPCLVVETSPGNYQAWIRLIADGSVDYLVVTQVVRHLAKVYGSDERAVSPRQPGRVPGFTNRKPKHRMSDGKFPFVKLSEARPRLVATHGAELIYGASAFFIGRAARGALPETPRDAAVEVSGMAPDIARQMEACLRIMKSSKTRGLDLWRRERDSTPTA